MRAPPRCENFLVDQSVKNQAGLPALHDTVKHQHIDRFASRDIALLVV